MSSMDLKTLSLFSKSSCLKAISIYDKIEIPGKTDKRSSKRTILNGIVKSALVIKLKPKNRATHVSINVNKAIEAHFL
jgi:hypothetical protein